MDLIPDIWYYFIKKESLLYKKLIFLNHYFYHMIRKIKMKHLNCKIIILQHDFKTFTLLTKKDNRKIKFCKPLAINDLKIKKIRSIYLIGIFNDPFAIVTNKGVIFHYSECLSHPDTIQFVCDESKCNINAAKLALLKNNYNLIKTLLWLRKLNR